MSDAPIRIFEPLDSVVKDLNFRLTSCFTSMRHASADGAYARAETHAVEVSRKADAFDGAKCFAQARLRFESDSGGDCAKGLT